MVAFFGRGRADLDFTFDGAHNDEGQEVAPKQGDSGPAFAGLLEIGAADTQHGGEDTFSSTIQSLQDLEGFDVNLDEAEIERSIAEINEAIRRSALHKKV